MSVELYEMENELKRLDNCISQISGRPVSSKVKSTKRKNFSNKKLLVGLGIGAIAVSVLAALGLIVNEELARTMASNADLWWHVDSVKQMTLHSDNVVKADFISKLTGRVAEFNSVTGDWKIGNKLLANYVSNSSFASKVGIPVCAVGCLGGLLAFAKSAISHRTFMYRKYDKILNDTIVEISNSGANDALYDKLLNLYYSIDYNRKLKNAEKKELLIRIKNQMINIMKQYDENGKIRVLK